jgi:hypothetical protein
VSYRSKVLILSGLALLLTLSYFVGGRWYLQGTGEPAGSRVFESELLDGVDEVVMEGPGEEAAGTRLFKAEGAWRLSAALDDSRIPADTEAVAALFERLKNYEIFVRVAEGEQEWTNYSRDYEGSLVLRDNSRNTDMRERNLVIGDEVAGSSRRYVRTSDGGIHEGEDISDLLNRAHSGWADLSLFPERVSYESLAAVEFSRTEDGQGGGTRVRLERIESESGDVLWKGALLGVASGEAPANGEAPATTGAASASGMSDRSADRRGVELEEDQVRSALRSLFRVEGSSYLGEADSAGPAERIGEMRIAVAMETGRGTIRRCVFYEHAGAARASAGEASAGEASPGGYLVRTRGRIYTVAEQMLIGLNAGLAEIERELESF